MLIEETTLFAMLHSAPVLLSCGIAGSQQGLMLQRVYVIDASERFVVIVRYRGHSANDRIC
jgi:hypothetical protein